MAVRVRHKICSGLDSNWTTRTRGRPPLSPFLSCARAQIFISLRVILRQRRDFHPTKKPPRRLITPLPPSLPHNKGQCPSLTLTFKRTTEPDWTLTSSFRMPGGGLRGRRSAVRTPQSSVRGQACKWTNSQDLRKISSILAFGRSFLSLWPTIKRVYCD